MSNAWGNSWGNPSAWGESWGSNILVEVIDKHDGRKQDERYAAQKAARERLREQIRMAIDGPEAPILVPALEKVAEPGPEPLEERVDIGELVSQVMVWRAVREAALEYARKMEEDDAEAMLLL